MIKSLRKFLTKNIVELQHRTSVKAAVFEDFGDPLSVLSLKQIDFPKTMEDDQVVIKMNAATINPSDINQVEGTYGKLPSLPAIGGNEGVGTIIQTGKAVKNLKLGDRVMVKVNLKGTWIEENIFNEKDLLKIPDEVTDDMAVSLKINPASAYLMLTKFHNVLEEENGVVVQNGATSGVGRAVIQICKHFGVETINLVRDRPDLEEIKEELKNIGATHVFTPSELKEMTGKFEKRPMLGLNCVGGSAAALVTKQLAPHSTLVTFGGMSLEPVTMGTGAFIFKDLTFKGFWIENYSEEEKGKAMEDLMEVMKVSGWDTQYEKFQFEDFNEVLKKYFDRKYNKGKFCLQF